MSRQVSDAWKPIDAIELDNVTFAVMKGVGLSLSTSGKLFGVGFSISVTVPSGTMRRVHAERVCSFNRSLLQCIHRRHAAQRISRCSRTQWRADQRLMQIWLAHCWCRFSYQSDWKLLTSYAAA